MGADAIIDQLSDLPAALAGLAPMRMRMSDASG
jgi:hypothetical protein